MDGLSIGAGRRANANCSGGGAACKQRECAPSAALLPPGVVCQALLEVDKKGERTSRQAAPIAVCAQRCPWRAGCRAGRGCRGTRARPVGRAGGCADGGQRAGDGRPVGGRVGGRVVGGWAVERAGGWFGRGLGERSADAYRLPMQTVGRAGGRRSGRRPGVGRPVGRSGGWSVARSVGWADGQSVCWSRFGEVDRSVGRSRRWAVGLADGRTGGRSGGQAGARAVGRSGRPPEQSAGLAGWRAGGSGEAVCRAGWQAVGRARGRSAAWHMALALTTALEEPLLVAPTCGTVSSFALHARAHKHLSACRTSSTCTGTSSCTGKPSATTLPKRIGAVLACAAFIQRRIRAPLSSQIV